MCLQMHYNASDSDIFIAYRSASLAEKNKTEGWAYVRCATRACTTCVKRGNTCLRKVVDLYGDIDLGACVWCGLWSVKCSISL
jgi:hypothetical protein